MVNSLLLKGGHSDPIHDGALLWSWLQSFLGLFSKLNSKDWLFVFSFFCWIVEFDQLGE